MLKFDEKKGIMHAPIRMCVVCRGKGAQKSLLRLQVKFGKAVKFTGFGRSFYLCELCAKKDEKTLQKAFSKSNKGFVEPNLREIL